MKKTHPRTEETFEFILKKAFDDYYSDLYAYAKVITNSNAVAKDVVSEVFFDWIESRRDLKEVRDLKAYLFKSVRNGCIKILSRDPVKFELLHQDKSQQLIEHVDPESILVGKELDSFIKDTIENLPPHCQLVFKQIRIEKRKYEDVAKELGISVNTVKNQMVSATKYLKAELEKYNENDNVIKLISNVGMIVLGLNLMLGIIQ